MDSTNLSQTAKKKSSSIIWVVVFLLVIGVVSYYLWPKLEQGEKDDLLTLKIINQNLTQEQIEKYTNEFEAIKLALEEDPAVFHAVLEKKDIGDYQGSTEIFYYLLQLGMIKKYVGDYKGAEAIWIKVGEISPQNSTSFGNLADLYTNFMKDYDKAIPAYQTAIANSLGESLNIGYYRNFYYFYLYNLEDKTNAEKVLLEGMENNSENSELLILLASFYRDNGNKAKAIEYYQKALELDPADESVQKEIEKLK